MFTGIIQEIGKIKNIKKFGGKFLISIKSKKILPRLEIGSSVSVNGACLTVINLEKNHFNVEAIL